MGCNQSKIENEEAVARCKERKRFMKDAVSTRNAFAAAHVGYTTSLKNTGAALGDFAQGEVQNPQLPPTTATDDNNSPYIPPQQSFEIPLPPPPLPDFSPGPLQRAASMPEIKIAKPDPKPIPRPILEEEEEERELENEGSLRKRRSNRNTSGRRVEEEEVARPPPPAKQPASDHVTAHQHQHQHHHAMSQPQQSAAWEYFFPSMENIAGTSLNVAEEDKVEEIERKVLDEKPNRVDVVVDEVVTAQRDAAEEVPLPKPEPEPEANRVPEPEEVAESPVPLVGKGLKVKQTPPTVEAKRIVKHNVNLLQIFADLDDHFLKASERAHEVSKLLEATRLHYHSNFADNRGTAHLGDFVSICMDDGYG